MRKLDRTAFGHPADWRDKVRKALPDLDAFVLEAASFEKLALDEEARKAGFKKFAPAVLTGRDPDFPTIWGHCKESLRAMSLRKCSYCEYTIPQKRLGHVDHFCPKTYFPSLAYEWTNYFYSCGGCNGAKSSKWKNYIRPDSDDVEAMLIFHENGTVTGVDARAQATIDDFELNEEGLVEVRKEAVQFVARLIDGAIRLYKRNPATGTARARKLWIKVSDPRVSFSVAMGQVVSRRWSASVGTAL